MPLNRKIGAEAQRKASQDILRAKKDAEDNGDVYGPEDAAERWALTVGKQYMGLIRDWGVFHITLPGVDKFLSVIGDHEEGHFTRTSPVEVLSITHGFVETRNSVYALDEHNQDKARQNGVAHGYVL